MGERWLKAEEEIIRTDYPTGTRAEIIELIPDRTWGQIGVHARRMGIHRTSTAWGNSIREGRKTLRGAWSDKDNERFDNVYPHLTRVELLAAFPSKGWLALRSHAQRRGIHRTTEATKRQIRIGQKEGRKIAEEERRRNES
jgi:hypothetical protein